MSFGITLFYTALLALILLALSVQVVLRRRRHQVGLGTANVPELARAVRAHANFCEYVPVALILILLLESTAAVHPLVLHVLGGGLVVGRIVHGFFGLNRSGGTSPGRLLGTALTWGVIAIAALYGLVYAVGWWLAT